MRSSNSSSIALQLCLSSDILSLQFSPLSIHIFRQPKSVMLSRIVFCVLLTKDFTVCTKSSISSFGGRYSSSFCNSENLSSIGNNF